MDQPRETARPPYLPITSGKASDPGRTRELNEDHVAAMQLGGSEGEFGIRYAAVIADGMGGHSAGEIASRTAVDTFLDSVQHVAREQNRDSAEDVVVRAFRAANEAVLLHGRSSPANKGMGTTLTGLVVIGDEVYFAHVGDTRAYLVRTGTIRQLTRDDSWIADQVESGAMTENEAELSQRRNLLSQALGTKADVPIHTYHEALEEDDSLVLTTDGLHDTLSAPEIGDSVRHSQDTQEACEHLVKLARDRDGSDNISVVCLTFGMKARRATTRRLPRLVSGSGGIRKLWVLVLVAILAAAILIAYWLRPALLRSLSKSPSTRGGTRPRTTEESSERTASESLSSSDSQPGPATAADERTSP